MAEPRDTWNAEVERRLDRRDPFRAADPRWELIALGMALIGLLGMSAFLWWSMNDFIALFQKVFEG